MSRGDWVLDFQRHTRLLEYWPLPGWQLANPRAAWLRPLAGVRAVFSSVMLGT